YAYNRGIRTFDTARAYGDSEEVLGRYLDQANIKRSELTIISKFMPKTLRVEQNLNQLNIKEHLEQSLVRLNLDYLDGYLLHTPEEFYEKEMMNDLMKLKEEGLVRKIGVSIYEMNHALDVVKSGIIDAIQVPYNILDQRVDDSEFFEIAKRNSVTVFARSPFLQGLLTMAADEIPKHLSEVKIYINQLNDLSKKEEVISYNTKKVTQGDLSVIVSATGTINPTNSVEIGVEVSGTIKEIYVDFNDEVEVGQLLATLDTRKLQSEVDGQTAALAIANANAKESEVNLKNKKMLYDRTLKMYNSSGGKYPSVNELDSTKFAYEGAKSSLEASKAKVVQSSFNLNTAKQNLDKAYVRSSIKGIVLN
ncbi:MAG: hypothetical protein CVU67_08130, partial [Deltaproteobacteria bacterium HGW-Deltaproteobacteria-24]